MSYLGKVFMQLRSLLLLFEKIPASVGEPSRICGFFLSMRKMKEKKQIFSTRSTETQRF